MDASEGNFKARKGRCRGVVRKALLVDNIHQRDKAALTIVLCLPAVRFYKASQTPDIVVIKV